MERCTEGITKGGDGVVSNVAIITGSSGLVGSECVRLFSREGFDVVGIDNGMRSRFFGSAGSTKSIQMSLESEVPRFRSVNADVRSKHELEVVFREYGSSVKVVIHAAAQPSHDWASSDPLCDFSINATATIQLLELARRYCPSAVFVFVSTNKVYGDTPNMRPLMENLTRFEVDEDHRYRKLGIDEQMSIDQSTHSLFGVSKVAADLAVQEYGRYFGMNTVCFRCGCITGAAHSGVELHGFLSYLMKCAKGGAVYTVCGHGGKQVRDNIHASDLAAAFYQYALSPIAPGTVYNIGGGRGRSCSIIEAIRTVEGLTGIAMDIRFSADARKGDHLWWITDTTKFKADYPNWDLCFDLDGILGDMVT